MKRFTYKISVVIYMNKNTECLTRKVPKVPTNGECGEIHNNFDNIGDEV